MLGNSVPLLIRIYERCPDHDISGCGLDPSDPQKLCRKTKKLPKYVLCLDNVYLSFVFSFIFERM